MPETGVMHVTAAEVEQMLAEDPREDAEIVVLDASGKAWIIALCQWKWAVAYGVRHGQMMVDGTSRAVSGLPQPFTLLSPVRS